MGKKTPDIPEAPDPKQTIAAQSQANEQNLAQLIAANRINQEGPFGSITYSGGTGPNNIYGQTQKVNLAPDIESTLQNQQGLAKLLSGLSTDVAGSIDTSGLDLSGLPQRVSSLDTSGLPTLPGANDQIGERARLEKELFNRSTALLRPEFEQQRSRTEQTLADRGFDLERSAGATDELNRLDRSQNASFERAASDAVAGAGAELSRNYGIASDARGRGLAELLANAELSNQGRDAGLNETLLQRNLPYQDIQALSGLTPDLPVLTPEGYYTAGSSAPDVIGATYGGYNAALQNAQLQQQGKNSLFGGITDIAGAALPFILSDRRLKTNIEKIGKARNGLMIYKWKWNALAKKLFGRTGEDQGFMAQEVQKHAPEAVVKLPSGYLAINYMKLAEVS